LLTPSAGVAAKNGRPATTVHKDESLFSSRKRPLNLSTRFLAQAVLGTISNQIDNTGARARCAGSPQRQPLAGVSPALCLGSALKAWGRASEHHRTAQSMTEPDGKVSG